ncbi:hypothetical protein MBANPS3_002546 [Mucor bainieri]
MSTIQEDLQHAPSLEMLAQVIREHDFQHLNRKLNVRIVHYAYDSSSSSSSTASLTASPVLNARPLVSVRIPIMRDTTAVNDTTINNHNNAE